jgi:hypothetical protein
VRQVKIKVESPSGGPSVLDCPVSRPVDGRWSCSWDVTASNGGRPADGEAFTLWLQATDRFDHTSEWIGPWTVKVDAASGRRRHHRHGGAARQPDTRR